MLATINIKVKKMFFRTGIFFDCFTCGCSTSSKPCSQYGRGCFGTQLQTNILRASSMFPL